MEDRCFKFINELNSQVFDAHMKKITKDNLNLFAFFIYYIVFLKVYFCFLHLI